MACFTDLDYRNKSYPFVQTIATAAGIGSISYGCYDAATNSAKLYQFYNPLYVIGTTVTAGSFVVGVQYQIISLGSTTQEQWNTAAGTTGVTYVAGDVFTAAAVEAGTGTASLIPISQNCFVQKTEDQQYYLTNEALALALA